MPQTRFTMTEKERRDIESLLVGTETVSQFAHKATQERVKRMQARDERARAQLFERDVEALRPVVEQIIREMET